MDADMDDEPGAADISLTEEEAQLLIDLGERLREAMGAEDDMDMEDEDDDIEMEDDIGDELDDEEPVDDEGPGLEDDEPGMGAAYNDVAMQEAKSEIVQEVLRRVTKRLVREKLNR